MTTQLLPPDFTDSSDRELLLRFAKTRDERAFEEIVRRNGSLVMGVCRRVLGDAHDVEDAFQATFAVLARSAGKIRRQASLTSWLYGVAYRVSLKLFRKKHAVNHEPLSDPVLADHAVADNPFEQLARRCDEEAVDAELHALPDTYRAAMVLHYLDYQTSDQIAAQLRISKTAVEGRLKRGRAELRRRLVRRGVTLAGVATAVTFSRQFASAQTTPALIRATVESSVDFAAGNVASGAVSHQLAQAEIAHMAVATHKMISIALMVVAVVGVGLYGFGELVVGQENNSSQASLVDVPDVLAESERGAEILLAIDVSRSVNGTSDAEDMPVGRRSIEQIEGKLLTTMNLAVDDLPLVDVADYFQQQLDIPIVIDHAALEDLGISSDETHVGTFKVDNITAQSALRLILNQLQLDYAIQNEVLLITTEEAAEAMPDVRVYTTKDLPMDADLLIEVITGSIAPDTWEDVGGPGTIAAGPGDSPVLIIGQRLEVHRQVRDLLAQLRRALRQ